MRKKKIGILTYHHVLNEGAMMQTYSLMQAIKKYFPEYEIQIIDYRPIKIVLKEYLRTFFPRKIKIFFRALKRFYIFERFMYNNFPLSHTIYTNNYLTASRAIKGQYCAIIVGSDEVWKISEGLFCRKFPNIYWLPGNLGALKFSFAASANQTELKNFTSTQKEWLYNSLISFSLISVRDNRTLNLITDLCLNKHGSVFKIPDPTFMLDLPDLDLSELLKQNGLDVQKPMVAVILKDIKISRQIYEYFKSLDYQVVALSVNNDYADVNLLGKLNPLQWACVFKYFKFCVTHRFHGVIFSLKNKIPFLAMDDFFDYGENISKMKDLLDSLDMGEHYCSLSSFNISFLNALVLGRLEFQEKIDLDEKLDEMRNECFDYLCKIKKSMKNVVH